MKCLIFSDVHGNLPALEKMLKEEEGISQYISLGDVVNYGPWSNECVDLVESLDNKILIKGNHEDYFEKKRCPVNSELVKSFFEYSFNGFTKFQQISKYIEMSKLGSYNLQHTIDNKYVFINTEIEVDTNYIIGHSHYQFKRMVDGNEIINVGSVGQNRQFIDLISYCVYDQNKNEFQMKNLRYNIEVVINEMKVKNYPKVCIDYYRNKNRFNK